MSILDLLPKYRDVVSKYTWFNKSYKDAKGKWVNEPTTIQELANCTDDKVFYNFWHAATNDSDTKDAIVKECDKQLEQLYEKGCKLIEDTKYLSKDNKYVRIMISRPNIKTAKS